MKRIVCSYFLCILLAALGACSSKVQQPIDRAAATPTTQSLRETLSYLASDELEGRGIDTPGIDKAADYIAHRFKQAGLKHAPGLDSYFQPFQYSSATAIDPSTTLKAGEKTFKAGKAPFTIPKIPPHEDFTAASFSAEGSFSA